MRFAGIVILFILLSALCYAGTGDTTVVGKTRNGQRYGSWTYYDAHQHILKIEKYRNGKLKKTFIFNQSGHVIERINRNGVVTKFRGCGC